jgi:hypothetical protein
MSVCFLAPSSSRERLKVNAGPASGHVAARVLRVEKCNVDLDRVQLLIGKYKLKAREQIRCDRRERKGMNTIEIFRNA